MNTLETLVLSGLISLLTGTISSLVVTHYRLSREEDRRQSIKLEEWEEQLKKELHNAQHLLIDIITTVGDNRIIEPSYTGSPDKYVQEHDSPKLEKLDNHIQRIEGLSGRILEKHDNLGYYLIEISRQYRTSPPPDMSHKKGALLKTGYSDGFTEF